MTRARLFYNKPVLGDTLIFMASDEKYDHFTMIENNAVIYNHENKIIGINFFNANKCFGNIEAIGYFENEAYLEKINEFLKNNHLEMMEFDTNNYFYVGEVIECEEHPSSDHLHICKVDTKDEVLDIVCGAKNCRKGLKVVVAKINAIMPNGKVIIPSKLLNVPSFGMLCSAKELALDYQQDGILELNDKYNVGDQFIWKGLN